jgi:hypothetical protein
MDLRPVGPAEATTPSAAPLAIDPVVRRWLQLEGLAAFAAGLAIFGWGNGPWLLVVPLLLVPDVSMLGYLRDDRVGAFTYNLVHTWALGLAVLGVGFGAGTAWLVLAGAVLVAHVGMDRTLGYGMKLATGFGDTHLGRIGKARGARAGAGAR